MVDNFDKIRSIISADFEAEEDMFFYVFIMRRRKDGQGDSDSCLLHSYLIRSVVELNKLEPEIKLLSNFYGARAYISISPKSMKEFQSKMLVEIANDMARGTMRGPSRLTSHISGVLEAKIKRWLIDIDSTDAHSAEEVKNIVLGELYEMTTPEFITIPSVSGIHLILSTKFNTLEFKNRLEYRGIADNVSLHKKSALTILYANL